MRKIIISGNLGDPCFRKQPEGGLGINLWEELHGARGLFKDAESLTEGPRLRWNSSVVALGVP